LFLQSLICPLSMAICTHQIAFFYLFFYFFKA